MGTIWLVVPIEKGEQKILLYLLEFLLELGWFDYIIEGLDLVVKLVRHFNGNKFFELTQEFLKYAPGRTVELHTFQQRMILTDSSENIKAIMSSKV